VPNVAGHSRLIRAAGWTARHRLAGPFVLGLATSGALVAPFLVSIGVRALSDLANNSTLTAALVIPAVVFILLPYPIFFCSWLPGYVVGRSGLGRKGWWLLAAGFIAPFAIPLVVLMLSMLRSYGGSALTLPLLIPLLLIPLRLGYRRGSHGPPPSSDDMVAAS
jgi:hypothetical protein